MEKTENYKKAEELVIKGLATKNELDCIEFNVDYGDEAFGWIYPDEKNVTIYYESDNCEDVYDGGDIDLHSMQVVGCKYDYDIIRRYAL